MKKLEEYMNDPYVAKMQMPLREVHAIRLMIHDEIKDMTSAEQTAYFNSSAEEVKKKYGFKFNIIASAK